MVLIKKGSTVVDGNVTTNDEAGSSGSENQINSLNNLFSDNNNIAGMGV